MALEVFHVCRPHVLRALACVLSGIGLMLAAAPAMAQAPSGAQTPQAGPSASPSPKREQSTPAQRPGRPDPAQGPGTWTSQTKPNAANDNKPAAGAEKKKPASVEADVSTRSVAITSSFTGVEILVFGAIDGGDPTAADNGEYDVVVVVEGATMRHTTRKKKRVAGIWVNATSVTFADVPSYYAIYSTRPLDEIADPFTLRQNDIGFERIRMRPVRGWETGVSSGDLADFRAAVVRLKVAERRYVYDEYGVNFVGRNLFRATVDLPANVPVGPLKARIHLFRKGVLISTYRDVLKLERRGLERWIYAFAFNLPLLYGIFSVLVAIAAGLIASTIVARIRG